MKANSTEARALRQWAFQQALQCRATSDIVSDVIYKAAEIEAYVSRGRNPRGDFFACVRAALAEVEHASLAHVSQAAKAKVIEALVADLETYDALPRPGSASEFYSERAKPTPTKPQVTESQDALHDRIAIG